MIYVQWVPSGNDWAEGAWAEAVNAFGARQWQGEEVDARVLVQPLHGKNVQGEVDLKSFDHPKGDVLYIFGPDNGHLDTAPTCDAKVYIAQVKQSVTLWSHQAAAIVLHDRMTKNGDS